MTDEQATLLRELAEAVADRRIELDIAADVKTQAEKRSAAAEGALFDALEHGGLRQIRTARGLFTLNDLAWASVSDPEAARMWAEHNAPELLALNHQRLAVVVREYLKGEREELPAGVDYRTSRKITWRRS